MKFPPTGKWIAAGDQIEFNCSNFHRLIKIRHVEPFITKLVVHSFPRAFTLDEKVSLMSLKKKEKNKMNVKFKGRGKTTASKGKEN